AYEVLGLLIARTSGQSFEAYVADHLLHPLGMHSSTFLKTEVAPDHATTPHLVLPPTIVSPEYPYNRAHAPSSTLHSSAVELSRWAFMNLNRGMLEGQRVLSASSYDQLWHPHCPTDPDHPGESVGLSWFLQDYRGHRMIRHDGEDVGYQTDLVLLPEQGLAVTVLTNTIPGPVNALTHAILDLLLGIEPEFPKPPVLLSLASTLAEHGIQAAAEEYSRIQKTEADHYDFGPDQFLDIGYTLLEVHRYSEGLRIVQLGKQLFPDSAELENLLAKLSGPGKNR
ncbi:MAG: beta-lactamase family protein, partial [Chloroflexota bacterium]|nr:beta-lactamase family protein [Chloroflexota bacterium]